jgi:hypothetical protein
MPSARSARNWYDHNDYSDWLLGNRETLIDIGRLHATADRERTLPLPPVVGVAAVAGGVMVLIAGRERKHA